MRILAWLKARFRGGAMTHQTPAHDALGPALEARRMRITGLFTEADSHLGSDKTAEAVAACRQLALLLAELPISQAGAQSRHLLASIFFDLASLYRVMRKKDESERVYEQA